MLSSSCAFSLKHSASRAFSILKFILVFVVFFKTKPVCDNVGGWVCHNPVMHLGAQTAKNPFTFKQAGEFLYLNEKKAASLVEDATQVGCEEKACKPLLLTQTCLLMHHLILSCILL